MHPGVQNVQAALDAADAKGQIRMLPDAVRTAAAAAEALGVEVGAIANSLIFDADGEPLLVLTSGAHRVDTPRWPQLVGASALNRATPDFVRTHTGQPIGGVAPVGHPAAGAHAGRHGAGRLHEIWAAGGIPHAVFPTTYDELVRMTGGTPTEVA